MAVINGTTLLLYSEGVLVGVQRGLSINVGLNLEDATNKESAGWEQHISGMLNATIDLDALFSSPASPDMNAQALMNYILNKESLLIEILGLGYPLVGEADMSSLKFDAPLEGVMSLSGSLKVNGRLYVLSGTAAQMITDPDGNSSDYDTLTVSDLKITSAIKTTAGAKKCDSNTISVTDTYTYIFATFLTLNSGQLPTVSIWNNMSAYISNTQALVEGLNIITLTATATDSSASLRFSNSSNANWSTSTIYLFKK
jgi:predicted secreted protein